MRIAVFDPMTVATDPAGSCSVFALSASAAKHEITVFSSALDDSLHGRVEWVRVPVIGRPQIARYVTFKIMATLRWRIHRMRGRRYDIVQATETCVGFADLFYVHFCHTAYLRGPARNGGNRSLRSLVRRADHLVRARTERRCYASGSVVAVSDGLADELIKAFDLLPSQVAVIANPVDLSASRAVTPGSREAVRKAAGVQDGQLLLIFIALGHFERKGLPEALQALTAPALAQLSLVVVGGEADLLSTYQRRLDELGISDRVHLAGYQTDVRPWLRASDGFLLPSRYEAFSLALQQAAAAGLPLICTPVHGVSQLMEDGVQGILIVIDNGVPMVGPALERFLNLTVGERQQMGAAASRAVSIFDVPVFQARWLARYESLGKGLPVTNR